MTAEPEKSIDEIAASVVEASIYIHQELGNALLEGAYEMCLAHVLRKRGHHVETQIPMQVVFEEVDLGFAYRLDILVDRKVVLELKVAEEISPAHKAQLNSYLRLGNFHLGLLLNFGAPLMKDGIKRVINPRYRPLDPRGGQSAL